jgi:hypothetical protein
MPPVAVLLHRTGIFRVTELSAQPLRPALPEQMDRGVDYGDNNDEGNNQYQVCCS